MEAVVVDKEYFRQAMRTMASSVTVLATDGSAGRAGLTVSSLVSLSVEPPSVLCCVHRQSQALGALLENGVFSANILAEHQSRVADVFAGMVPEYREDRFGIADWTRGVTGAPMLPGALCSFDCRLARTFEFGTHRILVGEVLAIEIGADHPLIYADRTYRRLALA
ncbi:flavin reductase family protein [Pigmentiphaga sp. GD03639]|uniref:flavin reductase family protein n=1 Tax=unclassified Pigmentiphaga TaxID=2626614 RepID=UPI00105250E1|nr:MULTISPECIES: flavin reductase family protein [unclassified Pigmentiphaga]MDH2236536.1 flavin reductase family protein [Pigmentiphaga sp. GD03639]